ncbi:MAG: Na+/H+ antiporter NhaA, partial [Syntrophomonadaceae bacterium]|nr:Na+/H+ antiporter NhaA [Syntrophomonadaceae bacterium]
MKENTHHLLRHIMKPLSKFLNAKVASSILLLLAAVIAFIWANSSHYESYNALWDIPIAFNIGGFGISNSLGLWINDALMAIFFFVIGLEIKRELLVGELSSIQKAALPAIAALGGMVFPALIYLAFNHGSPGVMGWGIPMATDIAFALACLLALGSAIPLSLKVFLMALAIFDDMGAVLVIAVFYTEHINLISLGLGIVILAVSTFLSIKGVRKTYPYVFLGIALWMAFFLSGVHATIAGVLLAFTIPARSFSSQAQFKAESRSIIQSFPDKDFHIMITDETQRRMMQQLEATLNNLNSPLQRIEDKIYPFVNYFVLPIFALANAGVNISQGSFVNNLTSPIFIGVAA